MAMASHARSGRWPLSGLSAKLASAGTLKTVAWKRRVMPEHMMSIPHCTALHGTSFSEGLGSMAYPAKL